MNTIQKTKQIKRKRSKSQTAISTSLGEGDNSADTSTLCSVDGVVKTTRRRQEIISSTASHGHLYEDFQKDKSPLYGRRLSSSTNSRIDDSRWESRSLRSVRRSRNARKTELESNHQEDHSRNARKTELESNSLVDTTLRKPWNGDPQNEIPKKPPRKIRNSIRNKTESFEADSPSSVRTRSLQTSCRKANIAYGANNMTDFSQNLTETNPLHSDSPKEPPKVYQRRSLTHQNSFVRDLHGDHSESASTSRLQTKNHKSKKREVPIQPRSDISRESGLLCKPQKINGIYEHPKSWFKSNKEGGTWRWFTFWEILIWTLFGRNNSAVPSQAKELDKTLPIFPLNKAEMSTPPETGIRVTWLGHSSLVVQFDGLSILTDPIFSEYAGYMKFFGVKRIRKILGTVDDLPKIDAVVISHNHYDHLDRNTVMLLNERFGHSIQWFVPSGLYDWMRSVSCTNVTELNWWDVGTLANNPTLFIFTPAQHWSRRGLFDRNKSLWGSWSILGPRHKFFFAGDTGYCSAFKQIGDKHGPFDLAAIPIGSYDPRPLLSPQHVDPEGAVQIHLDVKAKHTIGIHWGTFILSDENYLEPPKEFHTAAKKKQQEDRCFVLSHGESKLLR